MSIMSIEGSNFRKAYSNLIKGIWVNPDLENEIKNSPEMLKSFGFDTIPSSVSFNAASGDASVGGYDEQMKDWVNGGNGGSVTFTIPPKPSIDDTAVMVAADSCCCCCCPCCCCT